MINPKKPFDRFKVQKRKAKGFDAIAGLDDLKKEMKRSLMFYKTLKKRKDME